MKIQRLRLGALAFGYLALATVIEDQDTVIGSRATWGAIYGLTGVALVVFMVRPCSRTWAASGAAVISSSIARAVAAFISYEERGRTLERAVSLGLIWGIAAMLAARAWETWSWPKGGRDGRPPQ